MSYLVLPGGIKSFKKATISFWFRVPQASLDAAGAEEDAFNAQDDSGNPPPLLGLVPLVVFGKEGTSGARTESHADSQPINTSTAVHTCVEQASDALNGDVGVAGTTYTMTYRSECSDSTRESTYYKTTVSYTAIPGKPTNPSFIAIDRYGNLRTNFESTQTGDVTLAYNLTSATEKHSIQETINECWTFGHLPACGDFEESVVSEGGLVGALHIVFSVIGFRLSTALGPDKYIDQGSSPRVDHPATTTYGPVPGDMGTGAIGFSLPVTLDVDTWHHVLVSVDMSGGSASTGFALGGGYDFAETASRITKTSTLYVAADDVNYPTGGNLFPDTNKVATGSATQTAFSSQASSFVDNGDGTHTQVPEGPIPSYSLGDMSVPAAAVGIPATEKYTDKVRHVEMAEFQMWTGKTLDTGNVKNRRAFIDIQGKPVRPNKEATASDPTTGSIALLGKPDIMLHGSGNWTKGHNTGMTVEQFKPTGEIKPYKPEPSLHGPQSPPR